MDLSRGLGDVYKRQVVAVGLQILQSATSKLYLTLAFN
jgi:hypothetical protein